MHARTDLRTPPLTDPTALAQALVRRPSITPADEGALDIVRDALEALGFTCRELPFGPVRNLYARRGTRAPNLLFAGHTDVVPPGDEAAWRSPPFAAEILDGRLYGRGSADMKGGIAAFIAAVARRDAVQAEGGGSISLLITGDEEGPAVDGTKPALAALAADGEGWSHALVGEPTSRAVLGDQVKVGRRGSLNAVVTSVGRQGHVAYPDAASNPLPPLLDFLHRITAAPLDDGDPPFAASALQVTSVDVGNPAHNVIPAQAAARFNVRFNTRWTSETLGAWIEDRRAAAAADFSGTLTVDARVTGEPFRTTSNAFADLLCAAVEAETGRTPERSVAGGTSDGRFIKDYAPVAEFGLVGATIHQVDEHAAVADLETLARIYARLLDGYFADPPA